MKLHRTFYCQNFYFCNFINLVHMADCDSSSASADNESLVTRLNFTAKSVLVYSINAAYESQPVKSRLDWKHVTVPSEADTFISNDQEKAGDVNEASSNSAIRESRSLKWNLRSSCYESCSRQRSFTWNEVIASNAYHLQSRPSEMNSPKQQKAGNAISSGAFSKLPKLHLKIRRKPVIQQSEVDSRICNVINSFDDDQQAATATFANTTHADVENLTVENESRRKLRWKLRSATRREDVSSKPELQRCDNANLSDCATMSCNDPFDQPLCKECFLSSYGNEQLDNDWMNAEVNYCDFPTSLGEQRNQINRNTNQLEIAIEDYEDNFADTFKNLPALHTPNPALSEPDVNDFELAEEETYQAFIANLRLLTQSENAVDGDKDTNAPIQREEEKELHEDGNASSLPVEMFNTVDNTDVLFNESSSNDTVVENVQIVNETVNCREEVEVVAQSAACSEAKKAKRTTRCRKAKPCTAADKATGSKRKYCKRSDRSTGEVATTSTTGNNCYSQMLVTLQPQQQQQPYQFVIQQNNQILNQILLVPVVVQNSAPMVVQQPSTNSNSNSNANAQQVKYLDDNIIDQMESGFCRRKPRLILKRRPEAMQPRNVHHKNDVTTQPAVSSLVTLSAAVVVVVVVGGHLHFQLQQTSFSVFAFHFTTRLLFSHSSFRRLTKKNEPRGVQLCKANDVVALDWPNGGAISTQPHQRQAQLPVYRLPCPRLGGAAQSTDQQTFTIKERHILGIHGLLPPNVLTAEQQVQRILKNLDNESSDLRRYVALNDLQDRNEKLFYRVLCENVEKYMPIVYTPTVGLACQKFGLIFRRPKGIFISIQDDSVERIYNILAAWPEKDIRAICVTDGERILGLGDLGAYGMGIPVGKLSLYVALAGVHPQWCLPVVLDVGTDNEEIKKDPFYIGMKHERIRDERYDRLVDNFLRAAVERFGPTCLIQFEDFANQNAFRFLDKYKKAYCTFNDDIQGTASVAVAGLISAAKMTKKSLKDHRVLFYGAGEAAVGIAKLTCLAMSNEGIPFEEAKKNIWMVDSKGLIVKGRSHLNEHKLEFAQDHAEVQSLEDIINKVKPTAIIGAATITGAFNETILRTMAKLNDRPIIFALSNPTSKSECTAEQAYKFTDGRAIFASGSPFDKVEYGGKVFCPGQGNNSYIFPGVALGAICSMARHIPDEVFLIAAQVLSNLVTEKHMEEGRVYPPLNVVREISVKIAAAVAEQCYKSGEAACFPKPDDMEAFIRSKVYSYEYDSYVPDMYEFEH
ncbi:NADP-dependent malic enzyme, mitochondrial [Trichinella patagoniensis]|uniref:Malic enzyme n=1 Tax=Trichinella patagoniensis TaxID=990121 RepID=A0A0V1A9I3_9BILA|nr:NADP-dependent malic enzyme, mitochondrial [Trichinella patagoniensis]